MSNATWTWGDRNVTTQGTANGSFKVKVGGPLGYYVYYYWFNFTHTFRYPNRFVTEFSSSGAFSPLVSGYQTIYLGVVGGISLTALPTTGMSPLVVQLSCETFLAVSGYSASWTFGDGNSSGQSSPNSTATIGGIPFEWWNYTHSYRYGGLFKAQVNVSSSKYYSTNSTYVRAQQVIGITSSATPASGAPPLRVAISFETEHGSGYSASWAFGDSNGSLQATPNGTSGQGAANYEWWNYSHTYWFEGTFNPAVNISSPSGDYVTATFVIEAGQVRITFLTFENWSSDWIPADIQVCLASSCSTVSGGQSLLLDANRSYTASAVDLQSGIFVSEWLSNAGSVSSPTSNVTQFTPDESGNLSLIAGWYNWAAYVASLPSVSQSVTSVTGVFSTPKSLEISGQILGLWVGIGGTPGTNLWQAGIQVNQTVSGTTMEAWWEACAVGSCNTVHWLPTFPIAPSDTVFLEVTTSGGNSTWEVKDLTQPGTPFRSGYTTFTPNVHTAEWAMEKFGGVATGPLTVTSMVVNGAPTSLYSPYLVEDQQHPPTGDYWTVGLLGEGASGSQFTYIYS